MEPGGSLQRIRCVSFFLPGCSVVRKAVNKLQSLPFLMNYNTFNSYMHSGKDMAWMCSVVKIFPAPKSKMAARFIKKPWKWWKKHEFCMPIERYYNKSYLFVFSKVQCTRYIYIFPSLYTVSVFAWLYLPTTCRLLSAKSKVHLIYT